MTSLFVETAGSAFEKSAPTVSRELERTSGRRFPVMSIFGKSFWSKTAPKVRITAPLVGRIGCQGSGQGPGCHDHKDA